MTLVLSVRGGDTIWMLTDRRLSYGPHRVAREDAVKCMEVQAQDGRALLGYAGLGATARGTQPSDWMSAVLRGGGGTLEQALSRLSSAANKELPRHIEGVPGGHTVLASALPVAGGHRMYTIQNVFDHPTGQHRYRYTRWVARDAAHWVQPIGLGGTGGAYLQQRQDWMRPLLRLVRANGRGNVSDAYVAQHLAELNDRVHRGIGDGSVGPRCLVVWRRREGSTLPGGAHQYFDGLGHESGPMIPCIANGMDVRALAGVTMEILSASLAHWTGDAPPPEMDTDELDRRVGELPADPDERLR